MTSAGTQLNHGFTRVPCGLLEAICRTSLTDEEHRVFAAVIRLTYDYGCVGRQLASAEISRVTRIAYDSVRRVLQNLEDTGMIERGDVKPGQLRWIGIVADFERWSTKSI